MRHLLQLRRTIQEEILFNIVVTESTCLPYGLPQRTINIELKKKKKKVNRLLEKVQPDNNTKLNTRVRQAVLKLKYLSPNNIWIQL